MWMPSRVPPEPWNDGRRTMPGPSPCAGAPAGIPRGGAGAEGGAGGLRKNDALDGLDPSMGALWSDATRSVNYLSGLGRAEPPFQVARVARHGVCAHPVDDGDA